MADDHCAAGVRTGLAKPKSMLTYGTYLGAQRTRFLRSFEKARLVECLTLANIHVAAKGDYQIINNQTSTGGRWRADRGKQGPLGV